jgi:3-hydroxybutyrate dehydrogenase
VHGLVASPFKGGYVAAKHGVLGLVKVLALEGAEAGISASALCPGYVRTALVEAQLEDRSEEDLLAPHAVKRLLDPSEVAAAASFLLGPDGRAVTGTPLVLDLGWTAR